MDVGFNSLLDLDAFTLRIAEADAEKLPQILQAIPQQRVEALQRRIGQVWQRYAWSSYHTYAPTIRRYKESNWAEGERRIAEGGKDGLSLPARVPPSVDLARDDAFHTLMQWLYARLKNVA